MNQSPWILKWPCLILAGVLVLSFSGEAWATGCRYRGYGVHKHWTGRSTYIYARHRSHHRYRSHHGYRPYYSHRPTRYLSRPKYVSRRQAQGRVVVINVLNDNGSFTPVSLRKIGGTYIGPKGEHYRGRPTQEQLKAFYGLE